jgi:hypothetical protein
MTTPNDVIASALKKSGVLGVGQTASAEDTSDAFTDLKQMLATWQRKRWVVYSLVTASKASTGAVSYTVGPSGDFNIARPDRLESAFFRQTVQSQPNQIDYPLEIIEAREDYNLIAIKQLQTWPNFIFYDSAYPIGSVFPWPVPQSGLYEIFISVKTQLGALTSLTQTINLPPEYMAALVWNLAARLRPSYQLPPDPSVTAFAVDALNVIRNANAQVPRLHVPVELTRGGIYNVLTDRNY